MLRRVIDALLPQSCRLCGLPSGAHAVCAGCRADLPRLPRAHCPVCALPQPHGQVCGRCLRHPPAFDRTRALWTYDAPADRLIHDLKFHACLPLARFFAAQLVAHLAEELAEERTDEGVTAPAAQAAAHAPYGPDLLLAMPLHPNRLRERGFNQSVEIARALARMQGWRFDPFALVRLHDTPPQRELAWAKRRRNVRGAFACTADVAGLHVAVVDDVLTTGASLHELAKVLKAAGAASVSTVVLARTPRLRGR